MEKSKQTNLILLLVGAAAVIVGILLTVIGNGQNKRATEHARATVTEYVEADEYDAVSELHDTVYYPVMTYQAGGKTVTSQYSQSYSAQVYDIGETVDIRYNPDKPEEFVVEGDNRFVSGAVWVIPVGAVLCIIGGVRLAVLKKKPSEAA